MQSFQGIKANLPKRWPLHCKKKESGRVYEPPSEEKERKSKGEIFEAHARPPISSYLPKVFLIFHSSPIDQTRY